MKIGNFLVPEIRLQTLLETVLNKIYTISKTDPIPSRALSEVLGYTYGTEPTLFKKINSMLAYGILEGRGIYKITKLGEDLLYPESEQRKKELITQAIMNVEFWKKLHQKHGKNIPKDGLWVSIKAIAEIDPATAKAYQNRVYSWYTEDMENISESAVVEISDQLPFVESKDLSSKPAIIKTLSQVAVEIPNESFGRFILPNVGYVDVTDEDTLEIARSYLKILEKKLKVKLADGNIGKVTTIMLNEPIEPELTHSQ